MLRKGRVASASKRDTPGKNVRGWRGSRWFIQGVRFPRVITVLRAPPREDTLQQPSEGAAFGRRKRRSIGAVVCGAIGPAPVLRRLDGKCDSEDSRRRCSVMSGTGDADRAGDTDTASESPRADLLVRRPAGRRSVYFPLGSLGPPPALARALSADAFLVVSTPAPAPLSPPSRGALPPARARAARSRLLLYSLGQILPLWSPISHISRLPDLFLGLSASILARIFQSPSRASPPLPRPQLRPWSPQKTSTCSRTTHLSALLGAPNGSCVDS